MINQTSHIVEEMGLGPLWVRRHLQSPVAPDADPAAVSATAAAPASVATPAPTPAPAVVAASVPSTVNAPATSQERPVAAPSAASVSAPISPRSAPAPIVSKPSFDMDGLPSWLDEMNDAVSVSPAFIPYDDEDDDGPARVDVSRMDWPALKETVAACRQCNLCDGRKNTVFGVGDTKAKWLFVGEGPGRNEDEQGEPFVGKAGQLLDNMLLALNMKRGENVYIANIVKCRPTDESGKDRRPSQEEVSACLPYLKRQIELVQPTVVVALGHTAAWALLGIDPAVSVGKLRGKVHRYESWPVVVTYHPSYLLRQPQDKEQAWKDLCLASNAYNGTVQ